MAEPVWRWQSLQSTRSRTERGSWQETRSVCQKVANGSSLGLVCKDRGAVGNKNQNPQCGFNFCQVYEVSFFFSAVGESEVVIASILQVVSDKHAETKVELKCLWKNTFLLGLEDL